MKIPVSTIQVLDAPLDVWTEVSRHETGDEPVHLCDLTDVVRKYIKWTKLLPRVVPFYAVKANDSVHICRVLAALGAGFDCASETEIKSILDIGVAASRIIFANPAKPASHLKFAQANGVDMMTFDSANELHKIKAIAPNAKLVLRIRCDAKAINSLGAKFGCNAELEAPALLKVAQELQLEVIGVSFHVGTGCLDPPVFAKAISMSKKLFDVAKLLGFNFRLLDVGGGFHGDHGDSLAEFAHIINASLATHFPGDEVQVIAEPGRYFVSTAETLITRIHSKRQIIRDGVVENVMYHINDGIYGSLRLFIRDYDQYEQKSVPRTNRAAVIGAPLFRSTIWGPTCDSTDKVLDEVMLPELEIDDLIAFDELGAYSKPIACTFNGLPLPLKRYFIEQSVTSQIDCAALEEFISGVECF